MTFIGQRRLIIDNADFVVTNNDPWPSYIHKRTVMKPLTNTLLTLLLASSTAMASAPSSGKLTKKDTADEKDKKVVLVLHGSEQTHHNFHELSVKLHEMVVMYSKMAKVCDPFYAELEDDSEVQPTDLDLQLSVINDPFYSELENDEDADIVSGSNAALEKVLDPFYSEIEEDGETLPGVL